MKRTCVCIYNVLRYSYAKKENNAVIEMTIGGMKKQYFAYKCGYTIDDVSKVLFKMNFGGVYVRVLISCNERKLRRKARCNLTNH